MLETLNYRNYKKPQYLLADDGPIATYNQKIALGYALDLYDDEILKALSVTRKIRNQFAHARRLIRFNNPLIIQELRSFKFPDTPKYRVSLTLQRPSEENAILVFAILCNDLINYFLKRRVKIASRRGRKISRMLRVASKLIN